MTDDKRAYPASLSVDYPDRELNRLTSFFRLIVIIPIGVILYLVSGAVYRSGDESQWVVAISAGGVLFLATMLMLVFKQKYPRWWFDWNIALTKFSIRVGAYLALLRDEYPSTDEDQAVHIEIPYPGRQKGSEPVATTGEVVPGRPALYHPVLPGHCSRLCGDHHVVRYNVHRPLSKGSVRFRSRSDAVVIEGHGVRCLADGRRVSAIHPQRPGPIVSQDCISLCRRRT